jgi:hypothetical protein
MSIGEEDVVIRSEFETGEMPLVEIVYMPARQWRHSSNGEGVPRSFLN